MIEEYLNGSLRYKLKTTLISLLLEDVFDSLTSRKHRDRDRGFCQRVLRIGQAASIRDSVVEIASVYLTAGDSITLHIFWRLKYSRSILVRLQHRNRLFLDCDWGRRHGDSFRSDTCPRFVPSSFICGTEVAQWSCFIIALHQSRLDEDRFGDVTSSAFWSIVTC